MAATVPLGPGRCDKCSPLQDPVTRGGQTAFCAERGPRSERGNPLKGPAASRPLKLCEEKRDHESAYERVAQALAGAASGRPMQRALARSARGRRRTGL